MKIESYGFGKIIINGKIFNSDVIIYPDRVDDHWWRKEGHLLQVEDLTTALELRPDVLIVGTGQFGVMKVDPALLEYCSSRNIEIRIFKTGRAVEEFNDLSSERLTVAALHLTC